MITMNIHMALSHLKLLAKKINGLTTTDKYPVVGYKMNIKADEEYLTKRAINDFSKDAIAYEEKVNRLIENYAKLKNAINSSNENTFVTFNNKKMSISSIINYKKIIEYKKDLLEKYLFEYTDCIDRVHKKNERLELQIEKLRAEDAKENVLNEEKYQLLRKTDSWKLVDPINILDKINKLKDEIDYFETNIDCILSTSNAETYIEVDIDEIN